MRSITLYLFLLILVSLLLVGTYAAEATPKGKVAAEGTPEIIFLPSTSNEDDPSSTSTPTATPTATATATATATSTETSTPTATATATSKASPSPTSIVFDADFYVDESNAAGVANGTRLHPFRKIQAAINKAKSSGETTIAVAAGVYTENVRIENKTIHLYGGFAGGTPASYAAGDGGEFGERQPLTTTTQIAGDGTDSVVTLIDARSSTVDGFRVTGGTRSLVPEFGDLGGGFYVTGGSPTISNNVIEDNDTRPPTGGQADQLGGGIFAGASDISILDNVIRNNTAGRGGGIAISGGKVLIDGNTVQGNIGVSDHGGGLYIASEDAEVSHNLIKDNEIGRKLGYGWGGGMIVYGAGTSALLSFNTITGNFAPSVGGGVFVDDGAEATLDHELIYSNDCPTGGTQGGVGIYVDGYAGDEPVASHVTINHATVAGHHCPGTQGGNGIYVEVYSVVTITNSIFWGNNKDDFFVDDTALITMTYSTSEEPKAGEGNLTANPQFADAAHFDFHLKSKVGRWNPKANGGAGGWVVDSIQSPAIDAADPAAPFANEPGPNGSRANMGVYGNTVEASKSISP